MIIKELQPGDRFIQNHHGENICFEVIAINPVGRQYEVSFRSQLGEASAYYPGNAHITISPTRDNQAALN
ncbi:hypothetical protein [Parachitinimonas caeni]|uniref:Uncharacterized protein n=1 Tax=Parachitinimonas caeni TaxID=3031301 RepID=A0ABT7E318_9NEIS|nr:hypothetical protein [Parachitinimonas caeni]MDK2125708.1 hypothetical protein [Parachitinimonas caeni]